MPRRTHWKSDRAPGLDSLCELLTWVKTRDTAPILRAKRGGAWQPVTARQFYDSARGLCAGLRRLGLQPGDRVAILAESCPEWLIADFGCLAAGVVDVPIYPTLTAPQVAAILRDSRARGVFVSTREQAEKVQRERASLPDLEWIVAFDASGDSNPGPAIPGNVPSWRELISTPAEDEPAFDQRMRATPATQTATLLYTSGTTGVPKGVALTHANLCANLNVSTLDFTFGDGERRLSLLPLAHITERSVAYIDMLFAATTSFAESMDTVLANLLEVQPTFLVSVPRLFEKVAAGVQAQVAAKSGLQRRIFQWVLQVGRAAGPYRQAGQPLPAALACKAALAHKLVLGKLHAKLGGHLNKIICGGAPLGRELGEFLLALGLVIDEGYGLTETSPVISLNRPGGRRLGSIGRPLPNVEVRFAADGELLVRGPSVFGGYYGMPEATAEALQQGWFHTGDIGHQDADGFLYLTDRKKDLIKTSGAKFIAPQPIEAKLKAAAVIAEAVVVGDGRNYVAVLLVPDFAALRARGLAGEAADLCAHPDVVALMQAEVDAVNAGLARFETLKRFALVAREFTVASGELTPTLKVRRRTVEANYRELIDALYAAERA